MTNLSGYVLPNGKLDESKLWSREPLYRGMSGRFVERFFPSPERSYIFKPLTGEDAMDRETRVYKNVLSLFPPVYPKLLASSREGTGQESWLIFEDLGPLRHEYKLENAVRAAKLMAWWHGEPPTRWKGLSASGQKPRIESIAAELLNRLSDVEAALGKLGHPNRIISRFPAIMEGILFGSKNVLSHGDLHLGNYEVTEDGRLYIIDWEHAHLNTPYWDLFHLIDMSHPMFPKEMSSSDRERIIAAYIEESAGHGTVWNREEFHRDYNLFSSVFSLWMLLLIQGDLERGTSVWPRERLLKQWDESTANLASCLARLE